MNGDPMTIELVRFERPVIWETLGRSRRLDAKGEGQISATEGGSRLVMRMELSPKGALRLLLPILGRFIHQQQERNVAAIKQALEGGDAQNIWGAQPALSSPISKWGGRCCGADRPGGLSFALRLGFRSYLRGALPPRRRARPLQTCRR